MCLIFPFDPSPEPIRFRVLIDYILKLEDGISVEIEKNTVLVRGTLKFFKGKLVQVDKSTEDRMYLLGILKYI